MRRFVEIILLRETFWEIWGKGRANVQNEPMTKEEVSDSEAQTRFELYKNELVDIYSISHFDVKWIERECSKIKFDARNPYEPLVRFQNRIIRIIALRLKNEKINRFRTEKQFQVMMERYSKQI